MRVQSVLSVVKTHRNQFRFAVAPLVYLKHCPEGPIDTLRNCLKKDSDFAVPKDLEEERNERVEGQREIEELTTGLARAELALEDARDPEPR